LFPRHAALNLQLESLRHRACVASRHGQMLPRSRALQCGKFTSARTASSPIDSLARPRYAGLKW
jgi:hypothetical protein